MVEISERAQEGEHLARRKEVWEVMEAEKIQVGQLDPPVIGYGNPPPQTEGFASSTAAATGKSKESINRHLARAEALGDDLGAVIRATAALVGRCWHGLSVGGERRGYCDRHRYPEPMHDDDKRPDPRKATGEPFGHLTQRDTRTPEEKAAAEEKERARRKGRGRKDWWKESK